MGATVTTSCLACAFRPAGGPVYYVLFEESYDKRTFPQIPAWTCRFFGLIEDAVKEVFYWASFAEGGMLQNRRDNLTPEAYIAAWFKALASPAALIDQTISLMVGTGYWSAVHRDQLDSACRILEDAGLFDESGELRDGNLVSLSLFANAQVLADLAASEAVRPWHIFKKDPPARNADEPQLAYSPQRGRWKVSGSAVRGARVDDHRMLLCGDDGQWRYWDWETSLVAARIRELGATELTCPGAYTYLIGDYRRALQSLPKLVGDTHVVVSLSTEMASAERSAVAQLAGKRSVQPKGKVKIVVSAENVYAITALPARFVTWHNDVLVLPVASEGSQFSFIGAVQAELAI